MEELISRELHRLAALNLEPSHILIDLLEWEYLCIRTADKLRGVGGKYSTHLKTPLELGNSYAGIRVIPVNQLEGGFQVAVHNHTVRGTL